MVDDDLERNNKTATDKYFLKVNNLDFGAGESGLESFSNLQGDDSGLHPNVNQASNLEDSFLGGGGGAGDDDEGGGGGGGSQSFLGRNGGETEGADGGA